jgi:YD repeat-containing protein
VATGFTQYGVPIYPPTASINVVVPTTLGLGSGNVKVEITATVNWPAVTPQYGAPIAAHTTTTTQVVILTGTQTTAGVSFDVGSNTAVSGLTIRVTKTTASGDLVVANQAWPGNILVPAVAATQYGSGSPGVPSNSGSIALSKRLVFSSEPTATSTLSVAYRTMGSLGGYSFTTATAMTNNAGAVMPGMFSINSSVFAAGNYEMQYMALDANGNVLNKQSGSFNVTNPAAPTATQNTGAIGGIGGAGRGLIGANGNLSFVEQGNSTVGLATSGTLRYRVAGSNNAWTTVALTASATPGWLYTPWSVFASNTSYEFDLVTQNASGVEVNRARATFSRDASGNPSITALTPYVAQAPSVTFAQSALVQTLNVSYRPSGSTGTFGTVTLTPTAAGSGQFNWNVSSLVVDALTNYNYDVILKAYDANGLQTNQTVSSITLGATPGIVSAQVTSSQILRIDPPQTGTASIALSYRLSGTNNAYSALPMTTVGSEFRNDLTSLPLPTSGTGVAYDYIYDAYDAGGNLLGTNEGQFTLQPATATTPVAATRVQWTVNTTDSSTTSIVIHHSQTTNAFGDISSETDGLGHTTNLTYSTLGKLLSKQDPSTQITLNNGFQETIRSTTSYSYDALGRVVAVTDANGNVNSQTLLASSDDQIRVGKEIHADGGIVNMSYDIFGNLAYRIDEDGRRTDYSYDHNNQLTLQSRLATYGGTGGYDTYEYDSEGNRIAHDTIASASGPVFRDTTRYDALGRVTRTTTAQGLVNGYSTSYSYTYDSTIKGAGGATVGGWVETTTEATGRTLIDKTDVFGHLAWHQDEGGHTFSYAYNLAGWLTDQTGSSGQNIHYDYYANGYIKSIWDQAVGTLTSYSYDVEGNKTFEGYISLSDKNNKNSVASNFYEQSTITYDALNRVTSIIDPKASINYEYDANGNRRHMQSTFYGVNGAISTQDYWYLYDSMNRFTTTMGSLTLTSGGAVTTTRGSSATDTSEQIKKGTTDGVNISYDAAGQRKEAIYANDGHREDYTYNTDGYLQNVYINSNSTVQGAKRSARVDDLLGRTTGYTEYGTDGTTVSYSQTSTYDEDSRLLTQNDTNGSSTYLYYTNSSNNAATATGGGDLAQVTNVGTGTNPTTTNTYYGYEYWDEAKQVGTSLTGYNPILKQNNSLWKPGSTVYSYDVNGHLTQAVSTGSDGILGTADDTTFRYATDAQGLILRRDQISNSNINMVHNYYYLDGKRVGDVGNDGDAKPDYAQALAQPKNVDLKTVYKNWKPINSADFDQNYEPISPAYPGPTPGSYTVKNGETLQSIAQTVWGDSAMWYLLADANGLNSTQALKAGQVLTIPNKVTNIHNNSSTYQVYDPGQAIGDTNPTLPDAPPVPQPKHGCGGIASILIIAIAVVATVLTAGALAPVAGQSIWAAGLTALGSNIGIAAVAGAVGSIASQVAGNVLGVQDGFSWSGVAMGAIGAGIGAAIGGSSLLGGIPGAPGAAIRAAAGNALTQGVGVATGLQKKFDWAGVAAAAVGGAVSGKLNDLGANLIVRDAVSGLASGFTQQALGGGKFDFSGFAGNFVGNAIVDANTLGSSVVSNIEEEQAANGNRAPGIQLSTDQMPTSWKNIGQVADVEEPIHYGLTADDIENFKLNTVIGGDDTPDPRSGLNVSYTTAQDAGVVYNRAQFSSQADYDNYIAHQGGLVGVVTAEPRDLVEDKAKAVNLDNKAAKENITQGTNSASPKVIDPDIPSIPKTGATQINPNQSHVTSFGDFVAKARDAGEEFLGGLLDNLAALPPNMGGPEFAMLRDIKFISSSEPAVKDGIDLTLKFKSGWTDAQRAEALEKVQLLNDSATVVTEADRTGTAQAMSRYRKAEQIPAGSDIDHKIDLQLGGSKAIDNLGPLDSSVNRSLGAQIRQQIKNVSPGTRVNNVTIGD